MPRNANIDKAKTRIVYTIGGLDPSGGAGLPADARACRAFGAHACAITTAVIAQNTRGTSRVEAVSSAMLRAQIENLAEDIAPHAIKIGMLPNAEAVETVARQLRVLDVPIVLDPVFAPSSGSDFSDNETIESIMRELFPLCDLITPNTVEASQLCGFAIENLDDMKRAGQEIIALGARRVLVKGGHLPQSREVVDVLCDLTSTSELRASRIEGVEVRGTGCLLASAIAAQLAQNIEIETAVRHAKTWLSLQIREAQIIGKGRRVAVLNEPEMSVTGSTYS
jgi:hydroxymethylpyrimidine/phosphomethylpyrimidine kinase